jgi:outer membrane protein OmpA-like peptidoglycan-associated protein
MNRIIGYVAAFTLLITSTGLLNATNIGAATNHTEIIRSLAPIEGQSIANRTIDLDIRFAFGSARLSPAAHIQLNELGKALTSDRLDEARIGVYGHTDSVGSTESNRILSQKRAESVVNYLVERFAIGRNRLEARGYGEERLKNPFDPKGAENRRVEIVNLTPVPRPDPKRDSIDEKGRIQW